MSEITEWDYLSDEMQERIINLERENERLKAALDEIEHLREIISWYNQKNIEWQEKYDIEKEQLEQERDYLDGRCAALENDLVLDDVVSKLENVQTRLADFENMARAFVEYKAPDHICRMHFDLMLKESEE
jgi:chromosome segregation ATPase